jgi:hypothetical protein
VSNVLIGIIGVILFIGLALAGAMILGDDFKTSRASSMAAAEASRLRQVAQAIQMKNLKTGTVHMSGRVTLAALAPRFLKSGVNVDSANGFGYIDGRAANGTLTGALPAAYVITGGIDPIARDVCRAAAEGAGMVMAADGGPPSSPVPIGDAGCFRTTDGGFDIGSGMYVMYQRI